MAKYEIYGSVTVDVAFEVEASSLDEARSVAEDMVNNYSIEEMTIVQQSGNVDDISEY